jgi:signal recognition particle GTPase
VSHALKDDIIELKFGQKQTEEQVQEWLVDIEETLKTADENLLEFKRIKENIAKENQAVELAESVKQERAVEDKKHEQKMSPER